MERAWTCGVHPLMARPHRRQRIRAVAHSAKGGCQVCRSWVRSRGLATFVARFELGMSAPAASSAHGVRGRRPTVDDDMCGNPTCLMCADTAAIDWGAARWQPDQADPFVPATAPQPA